MKRLFVGTFIAIVVLSASAAYAHHAAAGIDRSKTVTIEGTDAVIARPAGLNISDAQFAQGATTWAPASTPFAPRR